MNIRPVLILALAVIAEATFALSSITPALPDASWTKSWWLQRFDAQRKLAVTGGCDVAFLGDSITHNWENQGKGVWAHQFAGGPYKAVNFGFAGDRTEHLLWRLDHGQLKGASPRVIVLMIGTNNTGQRKAVEESPTDTILGIQSILARLEKQFPKAKVILHPIFPRGATVDDPLRVRNDLVNSVICRFADGKRVFWCDFNARLLAVDGTLTKAMAPDLLHPGSQGYAIWAEELKPFLDFALGRTTTPPQPTCGPAPKALSGVMPHTAIPGVNMYWLANANPKVQARIRDKRIESTANVSRSYDAIWVGDSITHFWENGGNAEVFREKFGRYSVLNLGFAGDVVQNLLWNVKYGGFLDGVKTRLVMLMIGTNNMWGDTAEEVAAGIGACVRAIREKQPQAKLLLLSVLPREVAHNRGGRNFRRPLKNVDEIMPKQTKVNALIRPLADGKDVVFVDLVPRFTDAQGLPDLTLLGDGTHPNAAGCRALADEVLPYYRRFLDGEQPAVSPLAEQAATGTVSVICIPWSFPSNRIDWLFNPTKARGPFNPEWTWQLNRMNFWECLAEAYRTTGDEKYAQAFVLQFRDWFVQTGGVPPERGYNAIGSPWRTLEEGLRLMGSWPMAEDAFRDSPAFTPELKRQFVASMRAQAKHLMAHKTGLNWLLTEMLGVYTFAARHPEFPESEGWRRDSARIFVDEIRRQILPDGMQVELSPDYHQVCFKSAVKLYRLARAHGFEKDLPKDYLSVLERGAQAVLDMTTPSLVQPRFNDCYTIPAKWTLEIAAELFPQRKDFKWAASGRREGTPPVGKMASRLLPWSGFAAMRSDWGPDASYLAFDFGPLGAAHSHQDKLSFTLWKGGEELVFDDGGGQYDVSAHRAYAVTGYGHNTLLVDGLAQNRSGPRTVTAPIEAGWVTTATRDFIRGTYDDGFGPKQVKLVRHVREITFEKPQDLFRIVDTIRSTDGKDHACEILFQVDTTNVTVSADGRSALAHYGTGRKWQLNLKAVEGGKISLASGQMTPRLSGWFVGHANLTVHPATTISVKAPAPTRDHRFVTELLLSPSRKSGSAATCQ